jgi:hypothetical protein
LKVNHPFRTPEFLIGFSSFFLNFFWEVAQTYFYTMKDASFSTMLYGWVHCTLGDVMITLGSFWIISLINRNRRWFLNPKKLSFAGFLLAGVLYTILSEWMNAQIFKSWGYNELMPIIPWMKVGLTPLLQWIVIPSAVILLARHHFSLSQEATRKKEA